MPVGPHRVSHTGSSEAVEDYAKAIYALQSRTGGEPVSTNDLAERLGVTAASASAMVKKLAELGLADHVPYRGTRLTAEGERLALEVLRHHRLLELYLAEHLGVPWDRVHEEAEALEHVLSRVPRVADRGEAGRPDARPARRPDPDRVARDRRGRHARAGRHAGRASAAASSACPTPTRRCCATWASAGSAIGDELEVLDRQPFDGPLTVRFGDDLHVLGGGLARAMRVDPAR